jgi:hypothetical protein
MKHRIVNTFLGLAVAILVGSIAMGTRTAAGQEHRLTERLFRSVLTSVTPVYAPGHEGDPREVIGFNTESRVFEINEPIEQGLIPKPRQSGAEPIGRMVGRLRCLGNARVDRTKPMQVFVGTARYDGRNMQFTASGTSIIHWCQGADGQYNGIRWTDFSGTITHVEGRREGAHGHLVGTRLLVGDPDERLQSGLIIVRLLD